MSQAGNFSGYSLADALTGKIAPSGHLTTTWAENYTDYASALTFSHMNGDTDDEYYTDGIYVGYRYFDTFNIALAYPFGFGLAYTTFDIHTDEVKVDGSDISVKVTVKSFRYTTLLRMTMVRINRIRNWPDLPRQKNWLPVRSSS